MASVPVGPLPSLFVVDSRAPVREALARALSGRGHRVQEAEDLEAALRLMQRSAELPGLLLHDLRLLEPAGEDLGLRLQRDEVLGTLQVTRGSTDAPQEVDEPLCMRHPLRLSRLLSLVAAA